jgi:pSer/pThr/pTyr-binding forkhead associated (FHA) protein
MAGEQLRVSEGEGRGERLNVDAELLIGRAAAEEDGRLGEDPELSRRHARIARGSQGELTIEDLGSANGTFVNNRRLDAPRVLAPGDVVRLGRTVLEVTEGAPAPPPPEELVIAGGDSAGRRLVLGDELVLGRAADGDGRLEDSEASRRHARVARDSSGRLTIEDLGSANGTFVNGEPVRGETRLRTGDELRLGNSRLTFFAVGDDDTEITAVADGPPVLTRRERDLLLALCRPLLEGAAFAPPSGIRQMATDLFVSEAAVKFHLANLYDKFGLSEPADGGPSRRVTLAAEAIRRRAVTISDLRAARR